MSTRAVDFDAAYYKEHSQMQRESAQELFFNVTTLAQNERILDVGCGHGYSTKKIADRVPGGAVCGIDASFNMIRECKASYGTTPNLSFFHTPIEDYTTDQVFDRAVSFFVFGHIKDPARAIHVIAQSLKPGGFFHLYAGSLPEGFTAILKKEEWAEELAEKVALLDSMTDQFYEETFKEAGFDSFEKSDYMRDSQFSTKRDLFDWVLGFSQMLALFNDLRLISLTHDLVDLLAAGQEKDIKISTPVISIKARKGR